MITTIKDFYQCINELKIGGYNAPIKLDYDGKDFFIKSILLKNDENSGTFCSIELTSNSTSLKEELSDLINFVEENISGDEIKEIDNEIRTKAIEGINRIKIILNK